MTPAEALRIAADAAYEAMCRPPPIAVLFDELRADPAPNERIASLSADQRGAVAAYAARRKDLVGVYGGPQAKMLHERESRLAWLRRNNTEQRIAMVKAYYARDGATLADFINEWGYTIDPRVVNEGKNPLLAFSLFPKQRELIIWLIGCWLDNKPGVVVKSRDVGASWVTMALLCALGIFRNNFAAGVASAVGVKLDRSGDPDTLFYKIRSFLEYLPPEFNGGFDIDASSADKRVSFPHTGSSITAEAGDRAGRGGRKAIFIVDESAHFEHPKIIDKNLSRNTNCRIDLSSVNGMANSFYTRAHNPAIRRFDFTSKDDPRVTPELMAKMEAEMDEATFRQEVLCDFRASLEGVCIPADWIEAAIDIDVFLGIDLESGAWRGALDIADRGIDKNAYVAVKGRKIMFAAQWSGKGSDTGYSVQRAMAISESLGIPAFDYDADGMGGAAVHSDTRLINEARREAQQALKSPTPAKYFKAGTIGTHPYRGSEAVVRPEMIVPGTKRKAKDLFTNRKAQSWYEARLGFFNSWKARKGKPYDVTRVICIASNLANEDGKPNLRDILVAQLAQATVKETISGKIQIDKNPDDIGSPDVADAAVIALAPRKAAMTNMGALLTAVGG